MLRYPSLVNSTRPYRQRCLVLISNLVLVPTAYFGAVVIISLIESLIYCSIEISDDVCDDDVVTKRIILNTSDRDKIKLDLRPETLFFLATIFIISPNIFYLNKG